MNDQKSYNLSSLIIWIVVISNFVDLYDLLIFVSVRDVSLSSLHVNIENTKELLRASNFILNVQMLGLLLGGMIWGVLGDKKGRTYTMFLTIFIYSIATFCTIFVRNVNEYAIMRFISGIGVSGELGLSATLFVEMLPKQKRLPSMLILAISSSLGGMATSSIFALTNNWKLCYIIGGILGLLIFIFRFTIKESPVFAKMNENKNIYKGNFFKIFTNKRRLKLYCIFIVMLSGTWFSVGIILTNIKQLAHFFFAQAVYYESAIGIQLFYLSYDIVCIIFIILSRYYTNRKRLISIIVVYQIAIWVYFFSGLITTNVALLLFTTILGASLISWPIILTQLSEQFGSNLRATATVTGVNFARASVILMNMFGAFLINKIGLNFLQSTIAIGAIVSIAIVWGAIRMKDSHNYDIAYIEE